MALPRLIILEKTHGRKPNKLLLLLGILFFLRSVESGSKNLLMTLSHAINKLAESMFVSMTIEDPFVSGVDNRHALGFVLLKVKSFVFEFVSAAVGYNFSIGFKMFKRVCLSIGDQKAPRGGHIEHALVYGGLHL